MSYSNGFQEGVLEVFNFLIKTLIPSTISLLHDTFLGRCLISALSAKGPAVH